jgi:DICT domain-containing protein
MSNQELQELLIKKIRQTDDNVLLQEATRLMDIEIDDATIYVLSASEKSDIQEARQQIENGDSYTHSEANQLINEWLKK